MGSEDRTGRWQLGRDRGSRPHCFSPKQLTRTGGNAHRNAAGKPAPLGIGRTRNDRWPGQGRARKRVHKKRLRPMREAARRPIAGAGPGRCYRSTSEAGPLVTCPDLAGNSAGHYGLPQLVGDRVAHQQSTPMRDQLVCPGVFPMQPRNLCWVSLERGEGISGPAAGDTSLIQNVPAHGSSPLTRPRLNCSASTGKTMDSPQRLRRSDVPKSVAREDRRR